MDIYLGTKHTPEFNLGPGEEVVLQLTKDLEQSFFEPIGSKCQKWSTISRWKAEIASGFFRWYNGLQMDLPVLLLSSALDGMNNILLV